ncbi:hypothetical protein PTUN_a3042 [Pseudoalteromonas tunicata]|uniref:Uncharacterized protein n=1 Tax=Pseudoalteromonas tunicata D2 TaxID=87626 RepID=A4C656_9GAMM|nr:hypothetical protein PTUN_a3042 [Pseudoalteromonas tunicata]EAR29460.1 hypothetical protein PTD2_11609 [Pseudoalteromonas tunicata D2]
MIGSSLIDFYCFFITQFVVALQMIYLRFINFYYCSDCKSIDFTEIIIQQ